MWTTVGDFSLARLGVAGTVLAALELSPLLLLVFGGSPAARIAGGVLTGVAIAASIIVNRSLGRGLAHLVLLPVAQVIAGFACFHAGVLGRLRGGIVWRGTTYRNAELRAGRRARV